MTRSPAPPLPPPSSPPCPCDTEPLLPPGRPLAPRHSLPDPISLLAKSVEIKRGTNHSPNTTNPPLAPPGSAPWPPREWCLLVALLTGRDGLRLCSTAGPPRPIKPAEQEARDPLPRQDGGGGGHGEPQLRKRPRLAARHPPRHRRPHRKESNHLNVSDPSSSEIFVTDKAGYVDSDPGHGFEDIREQIFGSTDTSAVPPLMSGFV
ncbi:hypothetical protein ZWY2020_048350 [Hordeum vulgare]|nr:hypothetical protein ZWY2020_048350 [Hordeum vulgare]